MHKLRCENIEDEQFENLLEADLMDIECYLNSYVVNQVDEEKIDSTIDILKAYMPKEEVETAKKDIRIFDVIKENLGLIKLQLSLISRLYLILSLLLILVGTIATVKLNLSVYLSASIIAPIPILLGIFEVIKGREENVWELELSYKYSLREIILSRLIIINVISILISIIISINLNNIYSQINLFNMISIWLIPIFAISSVSLVITSVYRSMNSIALCMAVWILGAMGISLYEKMANIANINLSIALGISAIGVVISSKLFYKKSINSIDYRKFDF